MQSDLIFTAISSEAKVQKRTFRALESSRGVCAILVALVHLSAYGHFYGWSIIRHGSRGVPFFFVLSGFVMMHAYGHFDHSWADAKRFFLRRFGRLYPMHLAMLGYLVVMEFAKFLAVHYAHLHGGDAPFSGSNSVAALVANFFLLNGLGFLHYFSWNGPSWTISIEFWVYWIFFACLATRVIPYAMVALPIIAAAILIANASSPAPLHPIEGIGVAVCIYGFFLGVAARRYFTSVRFPARLWWLVELLALICSIGFFTLDFPYEDVVLPSLAALIIAILAHERSFLSRLLVTRPCLWIGKISYSIYMVHFVVLSTLNAILRAAQSAFHLHIMRPMLGADSMIVGPSLWTMDVLAILYILTVIAIANWTYLKIEIPWRDRFNRLASLKNKSNAPLNGGSQPSC
jgi:peptidoglycan/LPS O-acetylase OafA/YrhL